MIVTGRTRHFDRSNQLLQLSFYKSFRRDFIWIVLNFLPILGLYIYTLAFSGLDRMCSLVDCNNTGSSSWFLIIATVIAIYRVWGFSVIGVRYRVDPKSRAHIRYNWLKVKANLISLGFRNPPIGWVRALLLSAVTYGLMFGVITLYGAISVGLDLEWSGDPRNFTSDQISYAIMLFMFVVVLTPFLEEVLIRGMVLRFLIHGRRIINFMNVRLFNTTVISVSGIKFGGLGTDTHRIWLAIILSGVLFGLFHPTGTMIPISVMGVLFGLLRVVTGSLWPCILVHAIWNGVFFIIINVL